MAASTRLIIDKKHELKKARLEMGYTQQDWSHKAMVSDSTVKRFLKGQAITIDCFISLCKAVGIDEWREFADWKTQDSTRVVSTSLANSPEVNLGMLKQSEQSETPKSSIVVSGIFNEDDRQEIEAVLEHLKNLLLKHTVTIR